MEIDSLLKEKGMTKALLAEKMGIRSQNVNVALKNPTEETIKKIADALGVETWQLFASGNNKNTILCPKCGHEFRVKLEVEKT